MWEAYGLENEDLLWAGMGLYGGLGGNQHATCGAALGAAAALGLRHRAPLKDKEKAARARKTLDEEIRKLADSFKKEYGSLICMELIGVDFSDEEARNRARENGLFEKKCHNYIKFVVEKLYELDKG